jgi:thymidylate synthase ThyX
MLLFPNAGFVLGAPTIHHHPVPRSGTTDNSLACFPMARASVLRNKCRVSNKRNPTALPEATAQSSLLQPSKFEHPICENCSWSLPSMGMSHNKNSQPDSETDVYAVHGAEPEIQAYAMAKYSRSALSMKESLRQISSEKAEKFLNTYYFQYGHRSIADLAHSAFAIEELSLLAAIILVDEQRWDGQERSTRYQDFKHATFYVPPGLRDGRLREQYTQCIGSLFQVYNEISEPVFRYLKGIQPKPTEMGQEAYERTVRARAFDVCRYLLPLATNTSLGQIVNARTLESQIARLLSDPHEEVRNLGVRLKAAAKEPAYNPNAEPLRAALDRVRELDAALAEQLESAVLREIHVAPTLVKYADPNIYRIETRTELLAAAKELLSNIPVSSIPGVDMLEEDPPEIALATTLLYEHSHHSYRQIKSVVEALTATERSGIVELGLKHRGKHDELLRAFAVGQQFRFDILMDIGGFRDMHRHRRCIQIGQGMTNAHGFDAPDLLTSAGVQKPYHAAMATASEMYNTISQSFPETAVYVLPLGFRKRTLFSMDLAEACYITELRTAPAGHFSYREIAWGMYSAIIARYPELKRCFRIYDVALPQNLLVR